MPKKYKGEHPKAAEVRARKEAAMVAEQEKKEKAEEDARWEDDDKYIARKQQRKEDKETKRVEQLVNKKERQRLAEEEMNSLKEAKSKPTKVTRAEVQANMERQEAESAGAAAAKKVGVSYDKRPIEENVNHLMVEGEEAHTVEEAISVLRKGQPERNHLQDKRIKATYLKFEEENLPRLKEENPSLRLARLKEMLNKKWKKSPINPLNQR